MMKKLSRKSLILLIVSAMLLTATVAGTVAYMNADSGLHLNRIGVAALKTELVKDDAGRLIQVTNAADSIPAYVRVALVCSSVRDGKIISSWQAEEKDINTDAWMPREDGFWYYRQALMPGQTTENLLASGTIVMAAQDGDGTQLTLTALHQAIQAQGTDSTGKLAVTDAWGWTPPSAQNEGGLD